MANLSASFGGRNVNSLPYLGQVLWFRHAFANLVIDQMKMRYHRSVLGFLWSVLNPLFMMLIYNFVFSIVFRVQMENYLIYLLSSLLPFQFLAASLSNSTTTLVAASDVYRSHFIPKAIFPLATVTVALIDFVSAMLVLICVGYFFGLSAHISQLILPLSVLFAAMFAVGCGLGLSVLGLYFRDLPHLTGLIIQLALFGSAILFPVDMVPEHLRVFLYINPFYYLVKNFNMPLYYHSVPSWATLGISSVISLTALLVGVILFKKYESQVVFTL